MQIWLKTMSISLLLALGACQSMYPQPQGLVPVVWSADPALAHYQRQDQVEVVWKNQSFSFLLYQEQQAKNLQMLALSLTGQQLFRLDFDGQKVQVHERIKPMRLLPFDFVVRDILFATYPDFAKNHLENVKVKQGVDQTEIEIDQKNVLTIKTRADHIELDNLQVPYQMIFSPVENTLKDNSLEQSEVEDQQKNDKKY